MKDVEPATYLGDSESNRQGKLKNIYIHTYYMYICDVYIYDNIYVYIQGRVLP